MDFRKPNSRVKTSTFKGEAILENDSYKLFLLDRYQPRKIEIIGKIECLDKLFQNIEEALSFADDQYKEGLKEDSGVAAQNEPKERSETPNIENSNYILGLTFIVILGLTFLFIAATTSFSVYTRAENSFRRTQAGGALYSCVAGSGRLDVKAIDATNVEANIIKSNRSVRMVFAIDPSIDQAKLVGAEIAGMDETTKLLLMVTLESMCGAELPPQVLPDEYNALRLMRRFR